MVGAFCTLTFYDFFALRTIGKKHVPYRIAALSSFTSYSIGHNIGATVFTGGAIRFRIYSDYGLSAVDVAKICFLSGLTFWLGNTFVLGIGMAWHPWAASAMDQLPAAINRLIALGVIGAIVAYFVWLTPRRERRELGQNGWKVRLPSAPLTLVQILIGVVDLGFCAMAMYLLMPAQPDIDFISLAVVFILATLLGFASHAPGSIGVFDAAMLVALPEFGREQLLATLVVFRILYFMIPFGIAISIMGTRELWLNVVLPWQKRRRLSEACRARRPAEAPEVAEAKARCLSHRARRPLAPIIQTRRDPNSSRFDRCARPALRRGGAGFFAAAAGGGFTAGVCAGRYLATIAGSTEASSVSGKRCQVSFLPNSGVRT